MHFEIEVICVGLLIFIEMPFSFAEHQDSKPQIPWTVSVLFTANPHIEMSPYCLLL